MRFYSGTVFDVESNSGLLRVNLKPAERIAKTILRFVQLVSGLVLLAGCTTPIGVHQVSPRESYRELMANPLTEGVASNATNIVLRRFDLVGKYKSAPAAVIAYLHDKALHDERRDTLYALAELSYLYGVGLETSVDSAKQALAPDYFLLASEHIKHIKYL